MHLALLTSYLDDPLLRPSRRKIRDFFRTVWEIDSKTLQIKLLTHGIGVAFVPKRPLEDSGLADQVMELTAAPFGKIAKPYGLYYLQEKEKFDDLESFLVSSLPRQVKASELSQ